jgi:hypothetical protein
MGGTCLVSCIPFRFLEVDMGDIQAEESAQAFPEVTSKQVCNAFLGQQKERRICPYVTTKLSILFF